MDKSREAGYLNKDGTISLDAKAIGRLIDTEAHGKGKHGWKRPRGVAPIVGLVAHSKSGRARTGRERYNLGDITTIPLPLLRQTDEPCFIIRSLTYNLLDIPIRTRASGDLESTGFSNRYAHELKRVENAASAMGSAQRKIASAEIELNKEIVRQSKDETWSNGRCNHLSIEALPAKPMLEYDQDEVELLSRGYCMVSVAARYRSADLEPMLALVAGSDYPVVIERWQSKWEDKSMPKCITKNESNFSDFFYRFLSSVERGLFEEAIRVSLLSNALQKCYGAISRTCIAPFTRWRNKVHAIQSAPERRYRACEARQKNIERLNTIAPALQVRLEKTESQYALQKKQFQNLPSRIPLSIAECE